MDKWLVDLVFTGFWIGEGQPKFFSVCVNPPLRCGDLWQFERYEEALEAHGRVVAACRRCNHRKGNKTPEEANMSLRKKPMRPDFTHMAFVILGEARHNEVFQRYVY